MSAFPKTSPDSAQNEITLLFSSILNKTRTVTTQVTNYPKSMWYGNYAMITSVIGPGFGYSPSSNSGSSPTTSPAGRMGLGSTGCTVSVVPSSRWASSLPSSSTLPPYHPTPLTLASSPSTLNLFSSTLPQRHLLASSIINFKFFTGKSGL
ncbi:hypothetical protein K435DRAFT_871850 [Dendrothele bispora CBS 962.96]|uniref:Uncharacterized protein n=1 Tax=Dendrothele bispora (strain CBS 962.96) TaxID=1314807 RepID=A0A4S8L341_DENBC|nr:hypothetical protein K435DRAFT_871850 [Dendrothele bispora CBS 962.96]